MNADFNTANNSMLQAFQNMSDDFDTQIKTAEEDDELASQIQENDDDEQTYREIAASLGLIQDDLIESSASEDDDDPADDPADDQGEASTSRIDINAEDDEGENAGIAKVAYEVVDDKMRMLGITPFDYVSSILDDQVLASHIAEGAEKLAAVQEISPFQVADDMISEIARQLQNSDYVE